MVRRMNFILFVMLFVAQMAFDYYSSFILNPYGIQNEFVKAIFMYRLNYWVIHYVFIFVLGGYIAVHYDRFKLFMQEKLNCIRIFGLISLFLMVGYYYYCIFINDCSPEAAINTAHQLSPAGLVYTLGATIFLFAEFQYGILSKIGTGMFSLLGRHSYFVYLAHPVAITYLALFMAKFNIVMTAVHSMIFYVAVVSFTLIAAVVIRKFSEIKCPLINELTIGVYKKK